MNNPATTDILCLAVFDHGRLISGPVSNRILNTFCSVSYGSFRSLTVLTHFNYLCHVMLRLV